MNLDKAERQVRHYLRKYDLDGEWGFRWSRSVINFGHAGAGNRRGTDYQEICLSKPLTEVRSEHDVHMTILHEIAHAIVGLEHGHDRVWRNKCLEIGGNGRAKETNLDDMARVANYVYMCDAVRGGHVINISQKRLSVMDWECRHHPTGTITRMVNRGGVRLEDNDTINIV